MTKRLAYIWSIFVFLLLVDFCASSQSFWDRFDSKYSASVENEINNHIKQKQEHELFHPPAIEPSHVLHTNQAVKQSSFQPDPQPLAGLNAVGSTINWWTGEFRPSVVVWGGNMKNIYKISQTGAVFKVPDEIVIVDTPMVDQDSETTVQSNMDEFMTMKQKTFGFGIGYGGMLSLGGSVTAGHARTIFHSNTIRTAETNMRSTYFQMALLPPQYLTLKEEVVQVFNGLPRYDASTRKIWFSQFERFGSHVVTSVVTGGSAWMRDIIDISGIGIADKAWIASQAKLAFLSLTAETEEKRKEWSAKLDANWVQHESHEFSYQGGNTQLASYDQNAWLNSVPHNLTTMRYTTVSLAEFFPEGDLKEDIALAANEYLLSFRPVGSDPHLGPEKLVGRAANGASVQTSSGYVNCWKRCKRKIIICIKWETVCDPPQVPSRLIDGSGQTYIFGSGDGNQMAIVTLPSAQFISRVEAIVSPPGQGRPVTSATAQIPPGAVRGSYGPGNPFPPDGHTVYKLAHPIYSNQVGFGFGSAPPGSSGSLVNSVEVFAIDSSTPAGLIDSVSRVAITGWAFDPIDPTRALTVTVFADGNQVATGTTGVARPDVVAAYKLPDDARPGFNIPLNLASESQHRYEIYATFQGVTQQIRSASLQMFSHQPPGRLVSALPSKISGWAFFPDHPQESYEIDIYVNGKLTASGTTGTPSAIASTIFGTNKNYGFDIPLALKTAGQHEITAKVKFDNGAVLSIPDSLTVDLRFPKGLIFDVHPSFVSGFAYDPSNPDTAAEIAVYVDGNLAAQGKTTQVLQEYNDAYLIQGPHGFNISLRMMGGKMHVVDVYVLLKASVKQLIGTKSVSIGLEDGGDNLLTTGVINYAGVGYDPCSGEWRLRTVDLNFKQGKKMSDKIWENSNLKGLQVPDEIEITRNTLDIMTNDTQVFRTIKEWSKYESHRWKAGFSLGFFGFSQSYAKSQYEKEFTSKESRVAASQRSINLATVKLLPPELLEFSTYARGIVSKLPVYNPLTRPQYFRFLDLFGATYPSLFTLGGRMDYNMFYTTQNSSNERWEWEAKQTGFSFTYLITLSGSIEHQRAEKNMDQSFFESARKSIRFIGGRPEKFEPEYSDDWSKTVISNLAIVDMQLESVSALIEDPVRRKWMDEAIKDYMLSCTPERWLCTPFNTAIRTDGASVISISSRQPDEPDSALWNILTDPASHVAWGAHGEKGFMFADHDPNQWVVIDLGRVANIKKIFVDLDVDPAPHAIWDYLKVEISVDNVHWQMWAMVGDANGINQVKLSHYEFSLLSTVKVRYIKASFGAARPDTHRGGRIQRISAFTCV